MDIFIQIGKKRRHHKDHNSIYYLYFRENERGSYSQSVSPYRFLEILTFGEILCGSLTSLNIPIKVFTEL